MSFVSFNSSPAQSAGELWSWTAWK